SVPSGAVGGVRSLAGRQAVRHRALIPAYVGSNPTRPIRSSPSALYSFFRHAAELPVGRDGGGRWRRCRDLASSSRVLTLVCWHDYLREARLGTTSGRVLRSLEPRNYLVQL